MGEGVGGRRRGGGGEAGRCSQAVFTGLLEQPGPFPACWANRVVVGGSGMWEPLSEPSELRAAASWGQQ